MSRFTRALTTRLLLALALLLSSAACPAGMQALGNDSYALIENSYAGRPFLVALWSLDCPPCMQELEMLSRVHQEYPDFKIVLINTDGVEANDDAESLLVSFRLDSVDSWIFSSQQTEKLRFSIDPQWYGELPRSYLYRDNKRRGHSGLMDEDQLQDWLDSVLRAGGEPQPPSLSSGNLTVPMASLHHGL